MQNIETCRTRVCHVPPELARDRRDAVTALLTALKATVEVKRIVSNGVADDMFVPVSPAEYAEMTDLYSAGDNMQYASTLYRLTCGLVQLPVCVVLRRQAGTDGQPDAPDTLVFHIETGLYDEDVATERLADLERVDWAIEEATARSLSDRGVAIRRYLVDETDAEAVRHIDLGEISAQDYATRARLRDAMSSLCCGVYRVWEPTCAGWLVTNEQSDLMGNVYAYQFDVAETK